MQEFEVGSYVWFVRSDKPGVRHYLVVEEIVKKSIDGISRDYLFETVSSGKTGRVESRNLIGDYFINKSDAYDFMLKQAGDAIARMMDSVMQTPKVEDLSSLVDPVLEPHINDPNVNETKADDTIIELPDGTKARLKGGIPK